MNYKSKNLCRIRTITTFLSLSSDRDQWQDQILKASVLCTDLSAKFQENDYVVQSLRIVTNPFGEYLDTRDLVSMREGLNYLTQLLQSLDTSGLRVRFAIGEAKTKHEISLLPELIQEFGDLCNVCVNVKLDEFGVLDNDFISSSAKAVTEISQITPRGEGNFNFTVNFNCDPLIPYFPASYHKSELQDCFVIGLETPDLLLAVLNEANKSREGVSHNQRYKLYFEAMSSALQFHIDNIDSIIKRFETDDFIFSGYDSSAAPSKNCSSMTDLYEEMGVEYFGAAGTVEASALLTKVFKSIKNVDLVGFSGLMLALTEDSGLAQGSMNDHFDIRALLTYSAVCGIGLDTVPIPGDTSIDSISALMRDTGTMAYRLNKPLTVRVFPVPNLKAGDITAFESDDLCNCAVLAVP